MQRFYINAITLAIATNCCLFTSVQAKQDKSDSLNEIVVYADQNIGLSSTQTINQQKIKTTPNSNNNLTDYLKSNPQIRFEQSDENGLQRGEIKPANISINGADANQTAYFIDNVNINNDLMADSEVFDGSMQTVPGLSHHQAYFFDTTLLSSVVTHDSNISASLGGFMGGAVVAKTRQYSGENKFHINYRRTGSNWASLRAEGNSREKLKTILPDNTLKAEYQPIYKKGFFNISGETALSDNLGIVVGLSRRASHIKQSALVSKDGKRDDQYYRFHSDNVLINLAWTPNNDNRIELGLRHSNYQEQKFYPNTLNNNVKDNHQAQGTTLSWVKNLNTGVLTSTLAYDNIQDKRRSNSANVETVIIMDEFYDEIANFEIGGYGNSLLRQKNLHFSTEYAVEAFKIGHMNHSLSVGGLYQHTDYYFKRDQDVSSKITTIVDTDPPFTLDNSVAKKGTIKTDYQNIALYAEDLMSWKSLELRTGLRIERDDYLKNTNIAPRFVIKWQALDNTAFSVGLNRYYGRSFASLKLADKILQLNESPTSRYEQLGNLKTPYANELSLSLQQVWGNFDFNLKYIHRKNKNRIVVKRDNGVDRFQNGNDYAVNVYSLQIQNKEPWQLGKTHWNTGVSFDWLDTQFSDLDRSLNANEMVILDGKTMTRAEMRKKVNAGQEDWTLRFNLDMVVPDYGLTWSNFLWVKAPVKSYEEVADPVYRSFNQGSHTQWDSRLRWQPTILTKHQPYIQFDVLNVLNKTRKISKRNGADNFGEYTPGREFWLELGYEF